MTGDIPSNIFGQLLRFLDQLEAHHIHYDLKHVRESIMVQTYLPEGTWEIEFFEDGTLEAELLKRDKGVNAVSGEWLEEFIGQNKE